MDALRALSAFCGRGSASQICVIAVNPILPRRIEDVERHGVFEGDHLVRNVRRNAENLTRVHYNFFLVDEELQRTLQHVADLLMEVLVHWYVCALLQLKSRQHGVRPYYVLAREQWIQLLRLNVGPTMKLACRHNSSLFPQYSMPRCA